MDRALARWRSRRGITVEPPVRASIWLRPPLKRLLFPLNDEHACVVRDARSAWLGALATFSLQAGDEALATRSADGALLSALSARGLCCRWYDAPEDGSPESAGLEALLSARTRAVVLSYPLGFAQDAEPWRDWCERHGLLLLEDVAHALHAAAASGPVGRLGHAAVFRLTPVLGTPDGAVLLTGRRPEPIEVHPRHAGLPPMVQRQIARWRALAPCPREEFDGAWPADDDGMLSAASQSTTMLLSIVADNANADRRRANFRALLEWLSDLVPEGWSDVSSGSSPLVFPVQAQDPASLLERLATRCVYGWPLFAWRSAFGGSHPPGLERCVGLPVHQELAPAELDRIVEAVSREGVVRRHRRLLRLEWADDLSTLREEWEELALRAGNPFASWRWASVWWGMFGRGHRLAVLTHRRADGSLLGILPLYEARRRPIRLARFVGQGLADELGPVCDPADRPEVGWALRRAVIDRRLPWDVVLAERMPVEEGWSSSLGGVLMRREASPAITLKGLDWQDFLRARSRNFREHVGRRERKLEREYEVRYRLATDPDHLNADLDVLFALHHARWGDQSSALTRQRERFHRHWAAEAQRAGWLRLWFLELDGQTVAGWYGLRFAQREFYYQAGRDHAFDAKSVGFVLLVHTIRAAVHDGMHEYRLLRGGEPYKERFAPHDRWLETRAVPCSSQGAAAVAAATALAASPRRDVLKTLAGQ